MTSKSRTLVLFDVDGTLTVPRKAATPDMLQTLQDLRNAGYHVAIVGGSDLKKQEEQMGSDVLQRFDYVFSENGLLSFKRGVEIHRQNLVKHAGNDRIVAFVRKTLRLISDLTIPVQRGTFIELRNGMFNVSPIGRNCSQSERDDFEKYDAIHHIRKGMIDELQKTFPDFGFKYSIGGQISFDVFPFGWDKTYCLQFVTNDYDEIHFFGDKTMEGGNDFEIFTHPRVKGHHVNTFNDTIQILRKEFIEKP